MIQLNLTDDACQQYAEFYGWRAQIDQYGTDENDQQTVETVNNPQSCSDFVTQKLLDNIQNNLVEKRNRDAIEAATNQPLPDITN
jgi:hypothetical protein